MAENNFYQKDIHLEVVLLLNNCTSNKSSETNKMCPTCLDSILNKYTITLKCNHEYHRNCILKEILKLGNIHCVTCEIENYSRYVEQQEIDKMNSDIIIDDDSSSSYDLSLDLDDEDEKDDTEDLEESHGMRQLNNFNKFYEYQDQDYDDIEDFSFLK